MPMPARCNSCCSTHCCVTSRPWVPVEEPEEDIDRNPASYLPYWSRDHLFYWLRVRARASERARRNRY